MSQTKINPPHIMDASISTATVDIQVMRIGTKQMTLAVFRQLPVKGIFDGFGALLAPAWGWVNYDREGRAKPFIFSYEGILYRYDVNLEAHQYFTVKAETEPKDEDAHWSDDGGTYIPKKTLRIPTGFWTVSAQQGYYCDVYLRFKSEADAREYLADRLGSVAALAAAPQLFIGV